MALDLTQVPTQALERLLEAVRTDRIGVPPSGFALRAHGLAVLVEHEASLAALSRDSLVAVVEAVLSERLRRPRPPELVWTGPENRAGESRDTAILVQEMFGRASKHVTIAGFRFDHGAAILAALHVAMRDRGVACTIYADSSEADSLIKTNWPFGPPFPDVYGFVAPQGVYASLHAKCVVVDHRLVLATSANFTERGHQRNMEVGVLVDDEQLAHALEAQFLAARNAGAFTARPPEGPAT